MTKADLKAYKALDEDIIDTLTPERLKEIGEVAAALITCLSQCIGDLFGLNKRVVYLALQRIRKKNVHRLAKVVRRQINGKKATDVRVKHPPRRKYPRCRSVAEGEE